MTPAMWSEILSAHDDSMRAIELAFTQRDRASVDLDALYAKLYRRLDQLRAVIAQELGQDGAIEALAPMFFHLDEEVEVRLAKGAGNNALPAWAQLQRCLDVADGGDEFYVRARALIVRDPPPHSLVIGLYLFCLKAGFKGRYFDDPAAIERFSADLAARLGPAPKSAIAPPSPSFTRARTLLQYAAMAAGVVVFVQIVLLAITWKM